MIQARPYQIEENEATRLARAAGHRSNLVVSPTGTGKTEMFIEHIRQAIEQGLSVMVIVDRLELVSQTVERIIQRLNVYPDIEQGDLSTSHNKAMRSPVCVAIVQSLRTEYSDGSKRYQKFKPIDYDLILIDEAHLSITPSYMEIVEYFLDGNPNLGVIGFTATPKRGDGRSLGQLYPNCSFEYRMIDAINDGWLVPVHGKIIPLEGVTLKGLKVSGRGDYTDKQIGEVMENEEALYQTVSALIAETKEAEDRKPQQTIVFCARVAHARLMAEAINRVIPNSARAVYGDMPNDKRRPIINDFKSRQIQYLVNCAVLTTGFDAPCIDVVAMCRPTKSWSLFCLDADTQILTDQGWVGPDESRDDVLAAAMNVETGEIEWAEIRGSVDRPKMDDEQVVSYASPSQDWRVTDRHTMIVRRRVGRSKARTAWERREAADLLKIKDCVEVPVSGVQSAPGVPLTDDEIRFIGWVMTDGTINAHTRGITITQSPKHPWCHDLEQCLKGCGFKYTKRHLVRDTQYARSSSINIYTVSHGKPRGDRKHLRGWGALEPWLDKSMSPKLMESIDRRQLGVLLEAIHLGDGAKQLNQGWARRSYHITTANEVFADRIQSLCVRRGYACNISRRSDGAAMVLHIKDIQARTIGIDRKDRPAPELSGGRPSERVWCVETSLGTIVTRRNGKVTIMGNCQCVGRGTRVLPGTVDGLATAEERHRAIRASDKPRVNVLSFVGREGSMNLVGPEDVLAGDMEPPEVMERVAEILEEADGDVDVLEAIEEAREQIEEEAATRPEDAMPDFTIEGVDYQSIDTDWFNKNDNFVKVLKSSTELPDHHAKSFLEAAGYRPDQVSKWDPEFRERAVSFLQDRESKKLCTLKQSNLIRRMFPRMTESDRKALTKGEAGKLISMAKNRGKLKAASA